MGGNGVKAWETMEGVTVGLEDGEMATGSKPGSILEEVSSLLSREGVIVEEG
jgi:hypothetical protein